MLRTLIVLALIAYGIRHSVRGPFYALLFYLWIAYFRPEQWVWGGFLQTLPLSLVVGTTALLAGFMSGQLTVNARLAAVLVLVLHSLASTLSSQYTSFAWPYWVDFAKSASITWLIASLVTDARRFRLVMLVISLSLGFEAAKQGWAQLILNPGAQNINEISFIGDNNAVAIGMYVLVAFLVALGRTSHTGKERWLHRFLAAGSFYRGIATYSRGGFLAGGAMALFYFARSRRKLAAVGAMIVLALVIVPVLPQEFWDRMNTMRDAVATHDPASEYQEDSSFKSRRHFWNVAFDMAKAHPVLGIGHNAYTKAYDLFDSSQGEYGAQRSVHSMWLGTLAELGFPGLFLLILLLVMALKTCRQARRLKGDDADTIAMREFGVALEVSLVAIAVGGTFVIFQYTEVLWHVLGLSIALQRLVAARAASSVAQPVRPMRMPIAPRPAVAVRSV